METKLVLQFKKNPLQILQWSNLDAKIDGINAIKVPWTNTVEYVIEPGSHLIQMSFPYLGSDCGKAEMKFEIKEGETFLIVYKPPIVVYSPGKILISKV